MDNNEKWAIALDQSKMDNDLLKYVFDLSKVYTPVKIYLITVLKEKKSYSYLPEEYLGFMNQVAEDIKLKMRSRVDAFFGKSNIQFEFLVEYGSPFEEVINLVMSKTISLVIAGRKKQSSGSGVISDRLSRTLPCDFLIVPEEKECSINNVLVTTDFSEHSQLALNRALRLKELNEELNIYAFHAYEVPMGYSKSGKSFEEFATIMKSNAEKEMNRWLVDFSDDITSILSLNEHSLADLVVSKAIENKIDLIIIGSKGQTSTSLALLGSNTVKVIAKNDDIPVLIVKKPGENIDFLEALKQV